MTKSFLFRLEIDIINKCNLNCASCTHFSPLVKNVEKYDIAQFEKDIKRISELFNLNFLVLLGGEPLLNEDVFELIEICFHYFPNTNIQIYTNGILKDKILELIQKFPKLKIIQSKYPNINTSNNRISFNDKSTFLHPSMDLTGSQDPVLVKQNCLSNGCISLYNGKIYLCPVVRNISIFEEYFDVKLNLDEKEYSVDIYSNTANQILTFLNKTQYNCCKFCKPSHKPISWKISEKKITEWIE